MVNKEELAYSQEPQNSEEVTSALRPCSPWSALRAHCEATPGDPRRGWGSPHMHGSPATQIAQGQVAAYGERRLPEATSALLWTRDSHIRRAQVWRHWAKGRKPWEPPLAGLRTLVRSGCGVGVMARGRVASAAGSLVTPVKFLRSHLLWLAEASLRCSTLVAQGKAGASGLRQDLDYSNLWCGSHAGSREPVCHVFRGWVLTHFVYVICGAGASGMLDKLCH